MLRGDSRPGTRSATVSCGQPDGAAWATEAAKTEAPIPMATKSADHRAVWECCVLCRARGATGAKDVLKTDLISFELNTAVITRQRGFSFLHRHDRDSVGCSQQWTFFCHGRRYTTFSKEGEPVQKMSKRSPRIGVRSVSVPAFGAVVLCGGDRSAPQVATSAATKRSDQRHRDKRCRRQTARWRHGGDHRAPRCKARQVEITDASGRYQITEIPSGDDYVARFYLGDKVERAPAFASPTAKTLTISFAFPLRQVVREVIIRERAPNVDTASANAGVEINQEICNTAVPGSHLRERA